MLGLCEDKKWAIKGDGCKRGDSKRKYCVFNFFYMVALIIKYGYYLEGLMQGILDCCGFETNY